MGKKTQQNFFYVDVSKVQRQNPKQVLLLLEFKSIYISYALYTSDCVCSNEEQTSFIYTLSSNWHFP